MSRATFFIEVPSEGSTAIIGKAVDFLGTLGYQKIDAATPNAVLLRKGVGFWTAPKYIELTKINKDGRDYLQCDGFIIFSLFLTYGKLAELGFTKGVSFGAAPRMIGYKELDRLREHLDGGEITATEGKQANVFAIIIMVLLILSLFACCIVCNIAAFTMNYD